ncbi:PAT17 [Acrasis kona]|uniref:Palmitoyltransferase n=1 Tax=Acrasis kona TaxID=1008807 RepID=A0AAW2YUX4_9EUKA
MLLFVFVYAFPIATAIMLYAFLMGPTEFHKNGLIGKLRVFIMSFPGYIGYALLRLCCGKNGIDYAKRLENYMCYQRNPILQIVYLGLMAVNVGFFFVFVFPLWPNARVTMLHKVLCFFIILSPYLAFMKACFSDAGVITKDTEQRYNETFKNDNIMYFKDRKCPTCGIIKPPRSKHSVVTDKCISKFDHFCGWLNNDVGELNYKWFQLFLITNWISCFYGSFIYILTLWGIVEEKNLLYTVFVTPSGQRIESSPGIVFQYMLSNYIIIIAQCLFLFVVALMIFGFWAYHFFYLTFVNCTTYETFKWSHVQDVYESVKAYVQSSKYKENQPLVLHEYLYGVPEKQAAEVTKSEDGGVKSDHVKRKIKDWEVKQCQELEKLARKQSKLTFIYYHGILNNIMEVIWPLTLRSGPLPKPKETRRKNAARFLD